MTVAVLGLVLAASLAACSQAVETLPTRTPQPSPTARPLSTKAPTAAALPATRTARPTEAPTQSSPPSAPPTATRFVPTPFPTSLEAYGMHYDPQATLSLPPWGSISMLFWGQGIPVTPYLSTPELIACPTPRSPPASVDPLAQAGCASVNRWGEAQCAPDSPLMAFDCDWIMDVGDIGWGLDPQIPLVSVCEKLTEEHEAARAGGFYIVGCAFKRTIHYIFEIDGEYTLISDPEDLVDLFAPIDTPGEALSYARLATGLEAVYAFDYDPALMYFHQTIEGTRVTREGDAYVMNLFHFQGCGCEPWVTTRITLRLDRAGIITWGDAVPIFMTTGWSCRD